VAATSADWEALYARELPRVYNFFRYRVGDGALAEDLTAATFEKAWRARDRYRRDLGAFSTWLFTIARRVAVDHFRRARPEVPLEAARRQAGEASPEDAAAQRRDAARQARLLAELPAAERELVALKYGAGLTNREVARLTGLSETNVGTRLHRMVLKLRRAWEADE
jgi:RNA polymerase sigma-70 factor (ECF subfamily)